MPLHWKALTQSQYPWEEDALKFIREGLSLSSSINAWSNFEFMALSGAIYEVVREVLAIEVDTSLPAERVIRVLEQLKESRPLPRQIRVYNGPELISSKLVAWCDTHQIRLHHIQPGKPMQNGYIERFNKSFRAEVLDANLFGSLSEVREAAHQWMIDYNEERPHDSLGNLPPSLYRQQLTKTKSARFSTFQMCH